MIQGHEKMSLSWGLGVPPGYITSVSPGYLLDLGRVNGMVCHSVVTYNVHSATWYLF